MVCVDAARLPLSFCFDGRRLAFCSARTGSPQVYVMNVDGSGLSRVSHAGSYNTSPAWSPKGDRIAYTTRASGGFQIVIAFSARSATKLPVTKSIFPVPKMSPAAQVT